MSGGLDMGVRGKNESFTDFDDERWRSRPRKDRGGKRTARLSVRLTPYEYQAIEELAGLEGMTVSDYVVARALKRKTRLLTDNNLM